MGDLTKNTATLHVHFDDDVVSSDATPKIQSTDENGRKHDASESNGTTLLNYSRDDLMRLRNSSMAKRPPKFVDDTDHIDEKRKEKIRMVVKMIGGTHLTSSNKRTTLSSAAPATDRKHRKNATDTAVSTSTVGGDGKAKESNNAVVGGDEKLPSERDRLGFQQLMASASVPNAVNSFAEQQNELPANSRRQRVGSGRITENLCGGGLWNNGYRHSGTGNDKDIAFHLNYGVDYRHSNNDFFDKRLPIVSTAAHNGDHNNKVEGARSDAYEWNKENNHFPQVSSRESSTEPEWVSCGPTSKHDVIELHGFDGPIAETEENSKIVSAPPARSTPTKNKKQHEMPAQKDEHFNFEDFFKLDLPSGNHTAKGPGSGGESRFTQWFRRDSPPKRSANGFDANAGKMHGSSGQSFASTEQFIDLMHKTHGKKIESNLTASSAKFRSVEELEAELVPPTAAGHSHQHMHRRQTQEQKKAANDFIEFRKLLTQMEQQLLLQQQQQQQQQQHKANIVQQLYLLQQMNNTSQSDRERERQALMAILNVCNDNLVPRFMPQQQQQFTQMPPPPQFMPNGNVGQNFRQFQANIANGMPPHSPTQQELHFHTKAIMQNALLKKQYEDQYRKSQQYHKQYQHHHQRSSMTPSPQPLYHNNQHFGPPQFRSNKPKFNQVPQDGFQLKAPPQSKPIFGRFNQSKNPATNAAPAGPTASAPASPAVANNTPVVDIPAATSPAIPVNGDK